MDLARSEDLARKRKTRGPLTLMKQMIMWVFAAILICGVTAVKAQEFYDFSAVSSSGDTLYYYLDNGVAVVTCPGDIDEEDYWPEGVTQPQGALVIDGTVNHNDTAYTVARIGAYAFYGCSGITSVDLIFEHHISKVFYVKGNFYWIF